MLAGVLRKARWVRNSFPAYRESSFRRRSILRRQAGLPLSGPTKITMNVQQLGLSGQEVESILRHKYRIQVELSDLYNIILLLSIGDSLGNGPAPGSQYPGSGAIFGQRGSISKFSRALRPLPAALVSPGMHFMVKPEVTLDAAEGKSVPK